MREIKFRAFQKSKQIMRNVLEINLEGAHCDLRYIKIDNGKRLYPEDGDFELMQYTGLKDKNGNEICEGDLLLEKYEDEEGFEFESHYPVFFNTDKADWAIDNSFAKDGSSAVNLVTYFDKENLIVSGNIHENPELL